jgi:hypothetical protein
MNPIGIRKAKFKVTGNRARYGLLIKGISISCGIP